METVNSGIRNRKHDGEHQSLPQNVPNGKLLNGDSECEMDEGINECVGQLAAKAQAAQDQIMQRFGSELKSLLANVISSASDPHSIDTSIPDNIGFSMPSSPQKQVNKKTFKARQSILTELLEGTKHIRTVYNIFAAILIIFSFQTVVYDLLETGRIQIDFELIRWSCGKFPLVIVIWLTMMVSTFAVFPVFNAWATSRIAAEAKDSVVNQAVWDVIGLALYLVYMLGLLILPTYQALEQELPIVSSVIIVLEQIRMMMKTHSFVRENVPIVTSPPSSRSSKDDNRTVHSLPDFTKFLYFLFAPTLVYRDEYPRTKTINWSFAMTNMLQVVICVFYIYYIFIRFCVPNFSNFNREHVTMKAFTISMFGCMMPGTLVLLIGFFALLHCWLNAWAEMLRFADRLFYKDWWNSTSFSGYYRTWNVVVHDWLYQYVYQDIYMLMNFNKNFRWVAMHATFLLSAIFHEYVLIMALKFFYPILFFQFGIFGVSIIYVPHDHYERTSNIAMWVLLLFGTGILMCLYSMEWYARINCPRLMENWVDFLVPRTWYCESASGLL